MVSSVIRYVSNFLSIKLIFNKFKYIFEFQTLIETQSYKNNYENVIICCVFLSFFFDVDECFLKL